MLEKIHAFIWSVPTAALLCAFGAYFTFKSRFRQLRLISIIRERARELGVREGGIPAGASMATALGGTVGIGSIAGVGLALSAGGAGSVFWMWVTGFFGCMLKYAETAAAVKYRASDGDMICGGAMYALYKAGKKRLAAAFAVFCVLCCMGTGALTQTNAVARAAESCGIPPGITGAVFALCVLAAARGGRRTIARFCSFAVPAASAVYIAAALCAICMRAYALPQAFAQIFEGAFGLKQVSCGISGAAFAAAVRTGVVRGVYSTECGMGSSPIVHASNQTALPHTQGDWGILEVFADIFVFSTLTALAMLVCGTHSASVMFSSSFGKTGELIYTPLIALFGFAAAVSWCFYAESAVGYLAPGKSGAKTALRAAVAVCAYLGAVSSGDGVWYAADIMNLFMAAPNLYLLFIKRKEICQCFAKTARCRKA
jgi:AGCS family alanine or glycine:cation symporter